MKLLEDLDADKIIWPPGIRKKYNTVSRELELMIKAELGQLKKRDKRPVNYKMFLKPRPAELINNEKLVTRDGPQPHPSVPQEPQLKP